MSLTSKSPRTVILVALAVGKEAFKAWACRDKLLAASVKLLMGRRKIVKRVAADSTGLESGHVSPYFVRRRARGPKGKGGPKETKNSLYQTTTYPRFPKLTFL